MPCPFRRYFETLVPVRNQGKIFNVRIFLINIGFIGY
jgi:hypothetical protein